MPMSSLNVAEWSVEQVADWLSGLGPTVARYVPTLRARGLDGHKLLALRCDDLEYLGMHIIGHQELLLEAVEHLRNFQYEVSRECVQQLALRVSVVATTLSRTLRHHADKRLETQTLADVARTVHAVKPLVCWLERWPMCTTGATAESLAERRSALLELSLEAATSAMRDRFAEQPARAVAAAAVATAAVADYIIQDVSDPMILQPASLDTVTLRQGGKPLGFDVVPSFCGHHQINNIQFGSPAHASGAVHVGDEIVQVGGQCVIGWSGAAVVQLCAAASEPGGLGGGPTAGGLGGGGLNSSGELTLRVRRRAARAPPALATPQLHRMHRQRCRPPHYLYSDIRSELPAPPPPRAASPPASPASSDESEPLSPPASPTALRLDHTRMFPPKPRAAVQRRHTLSGGAPPHKRPSHTIEQFWQELKQQRWGREGGSTSMTPTPDDIALYARDKAVSCSTGLELSPRPRTCLGVVPDRPGRLAKPDEDSSSGVSTGDRNRGKLDKAHSTPAYDFDSSIDEPGPLAAQTIPESPTTPVDGPGLDAAGTERPRADGAAPDGPAAARAALALERSIARRDRERVLETINVAMLEHRRRSTASPRRTPSPRESPAPRLGARPPQFPVLRAVPRDEPSAAPPAPLKPRAALHAAHISVPLRHITKHDIRVVPAERRELPAINSEREALTPPSSLRRRSPPATPSPSSATTPSASDIVLGAHARLDSVPTRGSALSPTGAVRGIFPTSKSRSLKKKSSILAKRRQVPARALAARGALGGVWQRVRARSAQQPRWARRHLLLTHNLLYAYKTPECSKADCMIYLEGFTVSAAGEVKSRAHAFKVYHTGTAFYFACDTREAMLAWIQLIHRATLLPSLAPSMDISKQFSETDYSETESETESPQKEREKEKEKDKSKFGSLKKLTGRMQRSESQESVPHSSTSLDRKYLRFFSRHKPKDDDKPKPAKSKPSGAEHYRSYRKAPGEAGGGAGPPAPLAPAEPPRPAPARPHRLPKPINYIHASNPNLLDFDKSDFVTKPTLHVPKPKPKPENLMGFVTLEQFMLKKQAEERRQHRDLQAARPAAATLRNIVPEVIYGEGCGAARRAVPAPPNNKDGSEKATPAASHERWRDSLRRNDKVHSGGSRAGPPQHAQAHDSWTNTSGAGGGAGEGAGAGSGGTGGRGGWSGRQYPHLVCPPTFQPETYSLAALPPRNHHHC